MWGMPVQFSHLCGYQAHTLDSLFSLHPWSPPPNFSLIFWPQTTYFKSLFFQFLLNSLHTYSVQESWESELNFIIRNKKSMPSDSLVTLTDAAGRWGISQSADGSKLNCWRWVRTTIVPKSHFSQLKKQNTQGDYHKQYLLSRMVGLFLWRIFLNFPLKSLGGNGSRGKLAMRPRTTSSRPSEQSVSLSAMSLTALSSEDMLDGREPTATSIILPEESFEALPGFSSLFF